VGGRLILGEQRYLKHKSTTEEIKELIKDLKVLGKREFKTLLNWRRGIREELVRSSDFKTFFTIENKFYRQKPRKRSRKLKSLRKKSTPMSKSMKMRLCKQR
jgi:hypothetical protein